MPFGPRNRTPGSATSHLDAHFDLGDDNPIYGRLNNATLVRRIMELDGVAPSNISMVGLRGIARKSQVDLTVNSGMSITLCR